MRTRTRASAIVAGAAVPLLLAAATTASPASGGAPRTGDFGAELVGVNADGSGTVDLHQTGTMVRVDLAATGLDDGIHVAHVHGRRQAEAECPDLADDADGNGFIDFAEGLDDYGPVMVTLSDGLNDRGATLGYGRDFTHLDSGDGIASLGPLEQYAVVVHGVDLDGDGMADNGDADGDNGTGDANPSSDNEISMPALCGVIERE